MTAARTRRPRCDDTHLLLTAAERLLHERAAFDVLDAAQPVLLLLVRHRLARDAHIRRDQALLTQFRVRRSCK